MSEKKISKSDDLSAPGKDQLGIPALIGYGSLAAPLQALMNPILIFLPTFYAVEVGLDLALVGLIFFLARSWDALTDPIVGALSDRTKSRFGRRRPWIVLGTPALMIVSYFVLLPNSNASSFEIGLMLFLFYALWTVVFIPFQAWGAEVSGNYDQRTRVATFRESGTVLGVLIGIGIPLLLVDPFAQPLRSMLWPQGMDLSPSLDSVLTIIFITVLVLLPLTAAAACILMPDPPDRSARSTHWRQTGAVLLRNKSLRRLSFGYFVAQLGFLIFLSSVQLLITRGLQIQAFLFLIFLQHIVAIGAMPIWLRLGKKFGKHRAYCFSLLLSALGLMALNLVPSGDLNAASLVFLFAGLGSSGKLIFPPALAADTVDYDTLTTGCREAGTHMAVLNLVNKSTFAISVGLVFPLLAFSGFDPTASAPDSGQPMLMAISTALPAILMLIGVAVMWNFPLNHQRMKTIGRFLERAQRRASATPS